MKQTPFRLGHDLLFDFSENYDLLGGRALYLFLALRMEKLISKLSNRGQAFIFKTSLSV